MKLGCDQKIKTIKFNVLQQYNNKLTKRNFVMEI